MDVTWIEKHDPEEYSIIPGTIKKQEYSLIQKTLYLFNLLLENNISYALILEDDNIIPPYLNFNILVNMILEEFKNTNGDVLFIGGTRDYVVKNTIPNQLIYYDKTYLSRGTHAYIINSKCIPIIQKNINYTLPLDHAFNDIIRDNNLKSGWSVPYIEQLTDLHINGLRSSIHSYD
jgi:hypothetical protein